MNLTVKRVLIALPAVSLLLAFGALASGETVDALLRRYPYDPACAWGRIGNGKGLIVRCLSEAEAQALRAGTVAALPASVAPSASAAATSAPAVVAPDETPEADAGAPSANDEKLDVAIGPVTADSGELGVGKLGAPKDKYVKCINDNGGLKEATAEVQVRFLLRAKGRAEGVSVAKRIGVTTEAARCVSEVVDRRFVGVPDAPIVGATVTIKFSKAAK
jgi:hypothetical protein